MKVRPVKTERISPHSYKLSEVLDKSLPELLENSVVAITSKIVAICENRVVPADATDIDELVKQESEYFLSPSLSKYGMSFAISHSTLVPLAGIDESNGNGNYILWPKDPQKSANEIRAYLKTRFKLKNVGVVFTDSTARPLHYGTEGLAIAYSGFSPLNDYIGQADLFGRPFKVSKANIPDGLAAAAVLVMGEGTEQTPIAIIEDIPFVTFQEQDPSPEELNSFYLKYMDDDLFAPFLKQMPWKKGEQNT